MHEKTARTPEIKRNAIGNVFKNSGKILYVFLIAIETELITIAVMIKITPK